MQIAHIAFECAPIYKTGGLGDVVGSLPIALDKKGIDTVVIMPKYGWIKHPAVLPHSGVPVWYVESPFFEKPNRPHDPKIQAPKYTAFARLALEELKRQRFVPDIIHCHDWHTGLVPLLLKEQNDPYFSKTKCIISIHNIAYQGNFPVSYITDAVVRELLSPAQKKISFLKEGIVHADQVMTVSPNYAREIKRGEAGFGLTGVIKKKRRTFTGILNGIDYTVWNPNKDIKLYENYNKKTVIEGKAKNKRALQKQLGLEVSADIPLYGFIARFAKQKGVSLLEPILHLAPRYRIQIVMLGSGDRSIERALLQCQKEIDPRWYKVIVKFDEDLAHQMYAASDFFLVPSLFEPCGLTQMIAMAYGSIPVVSGVGGLLDTVDDGHTGFVFKSLTTQALSDAIERASDIWEDKIAHGKMVQKVMGKDFSWNRSVSGYIKQYRKLIASP